MEDQRKKKKIVSGNKWVKIKYFIFLCCFLSNFPSFLKIFPIILSFLFIYFSLFIFYLFLSLFPLFPFFPVFPVFLFFSIEEKLIHWIKLYFTLIHFFSLFHFFSFLLSSSIRSICCHSGNQNRSTARTTRFLGWILFETDVCRIDDYQGVHNTQRI